jgi:hypothetical protein
MEKYCRAGQATDDMVHVVSEIPWRNTVELDRPQMIWRMRVACRITEATNTLSEYVILIAFPLQKWLHERALLCYVIPTLPVLHFCLVSLFVDCTH